MLGSYAQRWKRAMAQQSDLSMNSCPQLRACWPLLHRVTRGRSVTAMKTWCRAGQAQREGAGPEDDTFYPEVLTELSRRPQAPRHPVTHSERSRGTGLASSWPSEPKY